MNRDELSAFFKSNDNEYLKFSNVTEKLHPIRDINLLLLLSKYFSHTSYIIAGADSNIVYFNVNGDDLCLLSDEQLLNLIRCSFCYDEDYGYMMV